MGQEVHKVTKVIRVHKVLAVMKEVLLKLVLKVQKV